MQKDIASIRRDYQMASLDEAATSAHPMDQFTHWWEDAIESNIDEVNAFVLSTIDDARAPSSRVVLLKGYTPEGFIFFTNYDSDKGKEMAAHPVAAMNFFWKELERQVRISGTIKKISTEESAEYFHSRPLGSQVGAWASPQSQIIPNREYLEKLVADGELAAFKHEGFWQCMDTIRDRDYLQELLNEGKAPWLKNKSNV